MRLSKFLQVNADQILKEWDRFAATVDHAGPALDDAALRDHAAEILGDICAHLVRPTDPPPAAGHCATGGTAHPSAAQLHADDRRASGFALDAMVSEYRALRAHVLGLWRHPWRGVGTEDLRDLTHFDEALDRAMAESVARYAPGTRPAPIVTKDGLTQAWLRAERCAVQAELALAQAKTAAPDAPGSADPGLSVRCRDAVVCRAEAEDHFRELLVLLRKERSSPCA